jgi:hypothetical protein
VAAAFLYALAKLFEASDHAVYSNFLLSGHTLKHLFAAAASFAILRHFQIRQRIWPIPPEPVSPRPAP